MTIIITFISSKDDNDEEIVMHSKIDNIEIMISDVTDEIIEKRFTHLKTDTKIIFNWWEVQSLPSIMFSYCIKNVINLNCAGPYIDFPDWIKNKKSTINLINKKDNKCFQYAVYFVKLRRNRKTCWENIKH